MTETIRATRPEPPPHVSAEIEVAHTPLPKWAIGEFFGTFLLVFFGCGSICAAVATGAQIGIFQVAIVWGLGIATAIYLTGSLTSAHLNPAVTIASAAWSRFPVRLVVPCILVQMLGAFAAAALLFSIFSDAIAAYEAKHGITRGAQGSEATAMVFGEYFPNPGGKALTEAARDLAPRIFSSFASWRSVPFTTNGTGWLTVYIIAPIVGGLLGGGIYRVFFRPGYRL